MSQQHGAVGTSVPRVDAVAKVTGAARFAIDVRAPGMVFGAVVRANRAHARIEHIDTAQARVQPGCLAVVTAADLTPLFARFGHIVADHPILATGKVRYYGEPVALVLAETARAARLATAAVSVTYHDLPSVMDADSALAEGAALVHESSYAARTGELSGDAEANVFREAQLEWGDAEAALAAAPVVLETRVQYPMLYAYAMEPYNALAEFTSEHGLSVVSPAQHPFMVQRDLARIFGLPLSKVRVQVPFIGGGYGSKSYTKIEPMAAVGAWLLRRPVKIVLDVEESIYTTRADSATVSVRSGFDWDGRILARAFDIVLDSGAYADNSPLVLDKAVNRCFGPYRIPNLSVRGRAVYTTTAPASSYRGLGAFQGNLAGETNLDQAAERLGIDAAELRRRNLVRRGETLIPGLRPMDADLPADLDALVASLTVPAVDGRLPGVGFGCSASDAGALPSSTAMVKVFADGSVQVLSGSSEMGQGSRTVLVQIAAHELGVPLARVGVAQSDTATTPFERTTGGSRTTTIAGLAVQRACSEVLDRLRAMAADLWECSTAEITAGGGVLAGTDGWQLGYGEVVASWFGPGGGEATGVGVVRREGVLAQLPPFWEIGMVGVGLTVDADTGDIRVDQLVTVADVGRAINPATVEGQDLGAATQGLGGALTEELVLSGPQFVNTNLVDYRVPRARDLPPRITSFIMERGDGVGPYGAKGVGEGALNPVGGAVAAAVARAVGVWPDRIPLTPERVWRLLKHRRDGHGGPAGEVRDEHRAGPR